MNETMSGSIGIGESVLYQTVGDEIVLLDMATQEYFGLDSVGADVWHLILEYRDITAVAKRLATIYAVDEQTARGDIEPLVSELLAAKLLKIVPSPDV
jgi:hypothetical protein